MEEKTYPYRSKVWTGPLFALLFGFLTFYFLEEARHNFQSLTFGEVIHMSPHGATSFYWTLCAISFASTAASLLVFSVWFRGHRYLTLSSEGLVVPKGMIGHSTIRVPYAEIRSLRTARQIGQKRILRVLCDRGVVSLSEIMFPSKEAFEEVGSLLSARTAGKIAA